MKSFEVLTTMYKTKDDFLQKRLSSDVKWHKWAKKFKVQNNIQALHSD